MKEILSFLRELSCNNNKEWFTANKGRYLKVQQQWYAFCETLIGEIGQYDEDIRSLTINRAVDYAREEL